jgi:hypothetical protein
MTLDTPGDEVEAEPPGEAFAALRAALGSPDRTAWWARSPATTRRISGAAGVVLLLAAAILAGSALLSPSGARPAPSAGASPPSDSFARSDTTAPTSLKPAVDPTPERVWPDEPITVEGTEVRRGNDRWNVGQHGDLIVIGDWGCNQRLTPAVLRPAVGLFVFDRWAEADEEVNARRVPGAESAAALSSVACGRAQLRLADGSTSVLDTRGAAS